MKQQLITFQRQRKMLNQDRIKIKLPNARQKLQTFFPEDPRGDIKIQYGAKSFKLQKAFLRLQSAYFKKAFTNNQVVLSISQKFKTAYFINILKCFYGFTIQIPRSQVLEYYPIVKYLQVDSLIKLLKQDMLKYAQHYDIFMLTQLAHQYDQQQIFETCLLQLQKQTYEQIRCAKLELMRCPMELFKMIIKTHNRFKAEKHKGVSFVQIDQLIKEYSDQKRLNQMQYQELKFELIDKNSLTSQQYKEIFLDDAKRKKTGEYSSMIRMEPDNKNNLAVKETTPFMSSRLTQSLITPNMISPITSSSTTHSNGNHLQKMNDDLALEMENTFEKKKNQELLVQNQFMKKQLEQLQEETKKNQTCYQQLKEIVGKLEVEVDKREKAEKEQGNIIKKLQKTFEELKKQLSERGQTIKKLQQKVVKLQKMPDKMPEKRLTAGSKYLPIDDQADQSKTIQSQIVPSHLLSQIAKPAAQALSAPPSTNMKKTKTTTSVVAVVEQKQQSEPDEEQLEQMYLSRLTFDKQPRGCPKKYLPNLANMLTTDGFQKKMLNLIFRRNIHNQSVKGAPDDIFGRDSLLVLICTRMNQIVGGFASIQLSKNEKDYIRDDYSFVFSLNKNEKFPIKKNCQSEALFITNQYLICFSNDMMISMDPCKQKSQSDWPCAYEGGTGMQKKGSKWLTGEEGEFMIKQIQIYEVKEEEMVMDL